MEIIWLQTICGLQEYGHMCETICDGSHMVQICPYMGHAYDPMCVLEYGSIYGRTSNHMIFSHEMWFKNVGVFKYKVDGC